MGNRLSKIYTRTGDKGTTGLGDGSRIPKNHERVEAMGDIDELNSLIGLLNAELGEKDPLHPLFFEIQQQLFNLGGELCMPDYQMITPQHIAFLESELDRLNEELPALKDFILPGGNRPAAVCHLARSVCRRSERRLVSLAEFEANRSRNAIEGDRKTDKEHADDRWQLSSQPQIYLNRLSDLLFVCARTLARRQGGNEVLWRHREEQEEAK
jgi:cob(I)alamin adenosyltransferase